MLFTELKVVIMNELKFVFYHEKHAIENTKYMDRTLKSHSSFIFSSFIFIWALPAAGLSTHTPTGLNHRLSTAVGTAIPNEAPCHSVETRYLLLCRLDLHKGDAKYYKHIIISDSRNRVNIV
jgi:hypothetical protein